MRKYVFKIALAVVVAVSLFGAAAFAHVLPAEADVGPTGYGAEVNPTGNPIGGGEGYNDIVDPGAADFVVSTKSQLLSALANARSGQTIYVPDDASIDMTGEKNVAIPSGVTLASGRGRSGSVGGRIFTNSLSRTSGYPVFMYVGSGARITGLRLRGPDGAIGSSSGWAEAWTGLQITRLGGVEVDNCEMYNWPFAAVWAKETPDIFVHHNYIHHNQRTGLGYGVCVDNGNALIEANLFDYNRHSVEGERGYPVSSYEARYNYVRGHSNGHAFDMHGGNDVSSSSVPAGGTIRIHHNTVEALVQPDGSVKYAVNIRGVPTSGAWVHNNWVKYSPSSYSSSWIFRQSLYNLGLTPYVKMSVYDNWISLTAPPVPAVNSSPAVPASPAGVTSGETGTTYTFSAMTTDPDGDTLWYTFDWGDGSTWTTGLVVAGVIAFASYSWTRAGTYAVRVRATDSKGAASAWSPALTVSVVNPNDPPLTPSAPSGPASVDTGTSYTYWAVTSDLDGDTLWYTFDWGDGSSWITSLRDSGVTVSASHSWTQAGTYAVRVKATDSKGAVSAWSSALTVDVVDPDTGDVVDPDTGDVVDPDTGDILEPNSPPLTPSVPSGPDSGETRTSYTYSAMTTDPDGDALWYTFDWGDKSISTIDLLNSDDVTVFASHTWTQPGTYAVRVIVTDSEGGVSDWSVPLMVDITNPNQTDVPPGRAKQKPGNAGMYLTLATDPNADMLAYAMAALTAPK